MQKSRGIFELLLIDKLSYSSNARSPFSQALALGTTEIHLS
jgi:hypothetical protein